MRHTGLAIALVLGLVVLPAWAQQDIEQKEPTEKGPATVQPPPATQPSSWLEWPTMTGDWNGARKALADKGIEFGINVHQMIQDNAHGGAHTAGGFRYSGSADLTLILDTGKMGLWPGGQFLLNAEPKWGGFADNPKVGSLIPVNLDAYKPGSDDGGILTLSEFFYQQVLFQGKLILIAGKLDGSRAFDQNEFANNERTQFMNLAFRNNPMIGSFLPYTTLGVGVIVNPLDWLSIRTAVADTDGNATTTGFNTAFHGPTNTTVIHEWDFTIKPFGQVGHQRAGFVWSCENFKEVAPISPFKETGPLLYKMVGPKIFNQLAPLLPYDTVDDNIMVYYNFDQYVYTKADDPTQGIGLFGRFGWARNDVNPVEQYYSIGLGGKGLIPTRAKDQYGVGYYVIGLSDNLQPIVSQESGVEMYYNFEITPWLHISPDMQVIMMPGGNDNYDTAVVWGLRMQMNL
jgi:porin